MINMIPFEEYVVGRATLLSKYAKEELIMSIANDIIGSCGFLPAYSLVSDSEIYICDSVKDSEKIKVVRSTLVHCEREKEAMMLYLTNS